MHVDIAMMVGWFVVPALGYSAGRVMIARQKRRITAQGHRSRVTVPVTTATTTVSAPSTWT